MDLLPSNIREEISQYLGSRSKPYLIPFSQGAREEHGCEYWELPAQKEKDKPILVRYQALVLEIARLTQENKDAPQIERLKSEANELLAGIPVTKKFGMSFVSARNLLVLDELKGIRKEWWELRSRLQAGRVSIFQGYLGRAAWEAEIANAIIAMPASDQYEFLRMNSTRGNNQPVSTEQIINALKKIESEFGLMITFAQEDFLEFVFKNPVNGKDRARIRRRLYRLCRGAEELTESIRLGRVGLWWD